MALKALTSSGGIGWGKKHLIHGLSRKLLAESRKIEKLSSETAAATFRFVSTGSMTTNGLAKLLRACALVKLMQVPTFQS